MNVRIYSMLDRKARAYGAVMVFSNDEVARRALAQVAQGDSMLSKYPEDFDCYFLGVMDDANGVISAVAPELCFNMSDLLRAEKGVN